MNKISKDDIRTLIVVVIVCILSVGIILILNRKSNSEKLENVTEYNTFYSITNYVNKYLNSVSNKNNIEIYNLLDNEYINQNNLTLDNLSDNIEELEDSISIKVNTMKVLELKGNSLYYVKGTLYQNEMDKTSVIEDNFEILIMIDYNNQSFSVYPLDNSKYTKVIDKIKKVYVKSNSYNKLTKSELINKEQICVVYLSNFVNEINNNIENSYNLIADNVKKQDNYSSLDKYKNYINQNKEKITTIADKCALDTVKNKRVYRVIDKNGNRYTFFEESIMNYKVEINFQKDEELE